MSVSRPFMDEVDVDTIEFGAELSERVQRTLLRAPIELVSPIGKQLSQVLEVGSLLPGSAGRLIRPARVVEACSQVRQDVFIDLDRERSDGQR